MNADIKYWYLRNHKLFSVMNNSQISDLCIITSYKKASKNDIIYFGEETEKRIFFLKKGTIKIIENDINGNEIIKEILQKGDIFGELALDPENNNSEIAEAISPEVIVCSFRLEDFEKVLEKNPTVALKFTKFVGFRFKRLENKYANLVFKDVRTRLVIFLRDWAEREGQRDGNKVVMENYLTHQEIASLICSTRQTTTQMLNGLEQSGLLAYSRSEIIIPDFSKLI
jgi:CRP/FNR family transcriptional regulator